jgi:hypothetical protein
LKEDYDQKAIHLLSAETGEVLWATDPKNSQSPRPMHSMFIHEDRLYGIEPHPGQAFYFSGRVCTTGKSIFRTEVSGYQAKPQTTLLPRIYGNYMVARTADRQDFDLKSFNLSDGKLEHSLRIKGVGPYDIHGRISTTVQHGRLVMLSKDTISQ